MPLHFDKTEEPSIDSIIDTYIPVNPASRTNSVASSNTTLVHSESFCTSTTTTFRKSERVHDWQDRTQYTTHTTKSTTLPTASIRSVGQRIETWPRVSGSSTRAQHYQEAIRLVRSSVGPPDKFVLSMAPQDLSVDYQSRKNNTHRVSDTKQAHLPLTIRQPVETSSSPSESSQNPKASAVHDTIRPKKERSEEPNNDGLNIFSRPGYGDHPDSHGPAEDNIRALGDASSILWKLGRKPFSKGLKNHPSSGINNSSPHGSSTPPEGTIPQYRPRIGGKSARNSTSEPQIDQIQLFTEYLGVEPDTPRLRLDSVISENQDGSVRLLHDEKLAAAPAEDTVLKRHCLTAKRGSCPEM